MGKAPRVLSRAAYVFHDARGMIHHVHEHIVLEGATPRPAEAMLEKVRTHAATHGIDVGKLKLLRVEHGLDPTLEYRVDVKRGALVGRPTSPPTHLKRAAGARKVGATRKKARKKR
jgi:hypothetical protein